MEGAEDVNTEIWERALAGAVGMEAVDEGREESEEGQGEWPRQELSPKPQGLRVSPLGVWGERRPAHPEATGEGDRRGPRLRRQVTGCSIYKGRLGDNRLGIERPEECKLWPWAGSDLRGCRAGLAQRGGWGSGGPCLPLCCRSAESWSPVTQPLITYCHPVLPSSEFFAVDSLGVMTCLRKGPCLLWLTCTCNGW